MFCSQCGAQAQGRFCWNCGAALTQGGAAAAPAAAQTPPQAAPDWSAETRYQALMAMPEVRERIARQASLYEETMSGEEFLELGDKVLGSLGMGAAVPSASIAELVAPVYERLGIRTRKAEKLQLALPVGRVLVAVLCSLARRGQKIRSVHQGSDGCAVEAVIPSDLRSFSGTLLITVAGNAEVTKLEAATKIGGQLFDWGKGQGCLRDLLGDVIELGSAIRWHDPPGSGPAELGWRPWECSRRVARWRSTRRASAATRSPRTSRALPGGRGRCATSRCWSATPSAGRRWWRRSPTPR